MRLARLVAAGLMLGATFGFVVELLRPRRDPRAVTALGQASAARTAYPVRAADGAVALASAAPLTGGATLTGTGGTH